MSNQIAERHRKGSKFFGIAGATMKTAVAEHPSTSKSPNKIKNLKNIKNLQL